MPTPDFDAKVQPNQTSVYHVVRRMQTTLHQVYGLVGNNLQSASAMQKRMYDKHSKKGDLQRTRGVVVQP